LLYPHGSHRLTIPEVIVYCRFMLQTCGWPACCKTPFNFGRLFFLLWRGAACSLRACSQRANESRSRVLITRSAGMPLFRAIANPQRVEEAISLVKWAGPTAVNRFVDQLGSGAEIRHRQIRADSSRSRHQHRTVRFEPATADGRQHGRNLKYRFAETF
jgi:hypothetical protein